MTKAEIIDQVSKAAREAQVRDDVCSRSTLVGLKTHFDWIPDDMIRASMSLCGGAGASSGSCGTFTSGLLAIGLKFNVPIEEELANPKKQGIGAAKFMEFRDRYLKAMGTTLCPELQKPIFGRSYIFTNPEDCEAYWKIKDHNEKCGIVVEKATRVIAEMLLEDEEGK
jgi:hypothetical protein